MSRRDEPFFWEDGVPYDEFVIACAISNQGAISAHVKSLSGRESLFGETMSHEEIIDMIWKYARGPSKRLRSGK